VGGRTPLRCGHAPVDAPRRSERAAQRRGAPRHPRRRAVMESHMDEMGPIDYIVLEWPGAQPKGEVAPLILDLVDRGIIRILDVAFLVKGEDGSIATLAMEDIATFGFTEFEGAASGLL